MQDKKKHFSIYTYTIIFVLLYLISLGLGAGLFFNFTLAKVQEFNEYRNKTIISENSRSRQLQVYQQLNQQKYDEAITSAENMYTLATTEEEKAVALMVRGEVYESQRRFDEAESFYNQSLAIFPELAGNYLGLANIEYVRGNYKEAKSNAQRAINFDRTREDYYFVLGLSNYQLGDKKSAIQNLERAVKAYPHNEIYKQALADIQNSAELSVIPAAAIPEDTTTQSQQPQQQTQTQPQSLGYTQDDTNFFNEQISLADQNIATLNSGFKDVSTYNQNTVNRALEIMQRRKQIMQQLLIKMNAGQQLTDSDFALSNQLDSLTSEENRLVQTLYNGNGGF